MVFRGGNEWMRVWVGGESENGRNKPKMNSFKSSRVFFERAEMEYSEKDFLRIMKVVRFLKIDDRKIMISLVACRKSIFI